MQIRGGYVYYERSVFIVDRRMYLDEMIYIDKRRMYMDERRVFMDESSGLYG